MTTTIRDAISADHALLALLHNATHEPHFHVASADLASAAARSATHLRGRLVVTLDQDITGTASYAVHDFDQDDRVWLDLSIHPDHLHDDTAPRLLDAVIERARAAGATSLWMPIREDYLDAWPAPAELSFHEVHRTFGGGFFLSDDRDFARHCATGTTHLRAAHTLDDGDRASAQKFYATIRSDKVTAPPTITAAPDDLDLASAIAPASFVAIENDECVGLCIVQPSSLGAWLSTVAVHPDHRRRGLGRSLLAASLTALRDREIAFLNTAGVRRDDAYLGLVRSLGATIEPDWISFQRDI